MSCITMKLYFKAKHFCTHLRTKLYDAVSNTRTQKPGSYAAAYGIRHMYSTTRSVVLKGGTWLSGVFFRPIPSLRGPLAAY